MPEEITLDVNGQTRSVFVDPATPLLQVLRDELGLTGAKFGCGLEQCGACAVLADGVAVTTCASAVDGFVGRRIVTVEGLSGAGELHPVQRAFIDEEAAQCGYCIPGMIVCAVGLLERTPAPDEADVRSAFERHLCRCGSQARIMDAVRRAASPAGAGPPTARTEIVRREPAVDPSPGLPAGLAAAPELDSWIRVDRADTVTVFTGKVEFGQGIVSALARIAAEELDLDLSQVRIETADTAHGLDEGLTAGSMSVEQSGAAIRQAAAEARTCLVEMASAALGVPVERLVVQEGIVLDVSGRAGEATGSSPATDRWRGARPASRRPSCRPTIGSSATRKRGASTCRGS